MPERVTKWGEPRAHLNRRDGQCSRPECDDDRAPSSRYCRKHRNEYMRLARQASVCPHCGKQLSAPQ